MTTLTLSDELAARLEEVARQHQTTVEAVLVKFLDQSYPSQQKGLTQQEWQEALKGLIGMFDDDIPDFSSTIRKEMDDHYQKKADELDHDTD